MAARTTRRTDEAQKILEVLRVPSFRPYQWELISALVLERRNVFAQLACGAGKTLVFIASLLLQCMTPGVGAIGLLVVPIDSIVSDAKRTLASYGIEVVELTADTERVRCRSGGTKSRVWRPRRPRRSRRVSGQRGREAESSERQGDQRGRRIRDAERQRGREAERQRGREAERQRGRQVGEAERQRGRQTGEAERQRGRGTGRPTGPE